MVARMPYDVHIGIEADLRKGKNMEMVNSDRVMILENLTELRREALALLGTLEEYGDKFHSVTIGNSYYELNAYQDSEGQYGLTIYGVTIDNDGRASLDTTNYVTLIGGK